MEGVTFEAAAPVLGYAHKSSVQREVNGGKLYLKDVLLLMSLCRSGKLVATAGGKTITITLNAKSPLDIPDLMQALLLSVQSNPNPQGLAPLKHDLLWAQVAEKAGYQSKMSAHDSWYKREVPFFMALVFLSMGFQELSASTPKASVTITLS